MPDVVSITFTPSDFKLPENPPPVLYGEQQADFFALYIIQIDGKNAFGAPIAPREITYSNFGMTWTEVNRDGKLPYLVREAEKLPKIVINDMVLAKPSDPMWDATGGLKVLRNISRTRVPLKITYGGFFESSFLWRCTDFSFDSVYRHPVTNAITRANVNLEFTMLQDVILTTGPVSGGANNTGSSTKAEKPPVKDAGKRKYKVKSGDTLSGLSYKFYKNTKYWRYLADINKIKDPKKLKKGQIIKY